MVAEPMDGFPEHTWQRRLALVDRRWTASAQVVLHNNIAIHNNGHLERFIGCIEARRRRTPQTLTIGSLTVVGVSAGPLRQVFESGGNVTVWELWSRSIPGYFPWDALHLVG